MYNAKVGEDTETTRATPRVFGPAPQVHTYNGPVEGGPRKHSECYDRTGPSPI
jgi:hypothetical protein